MSFKSMLQKIFSPPQAEGDEYALGDESANFEWTQNLRVVLAIVIVIISGFIVRWIMS